MKFTSCLKPSSVNRTFQSEVQSLIVRNGGHIFLGVEYGREFILAFQYSDECNSSPRKLTKVSVTINLVTSRTTSNTLYFTAVTNNTRPIAFKKTPTKLRFGHPRRPRGSQSEAGEMARRKFSRTGGRTPGYQVSPDHFQTASRIPAPDWAEKIPCIILPNRRAATLESLSCVLTRRLLSCHTCLVRSPRLFVRGKLSL